MRRLILVVAVVMAGSVCRSEETTGPHARSAKPGTSADAAEPGAGPQDETEMLIFGNSACRGLINKLPALYAADGLTLNVRCLRKSATGFMRAVEAIESGRATGEPLPDPVPEGKKDYDFGYVALETDYDAQVFLLDEVEARNWDIVVLVSNTGLAADAGTFEFFDKTAAFVRKELPRARIVLYQNFAVRNDDQNWLPGAERLLRRSGSIGPEETLTEDAFCWFSSRNYTAAAERLDAALLPAGDLLYWIRRDPRWGYRPFPDHVRAKERYDALDPPDEPDESRCLRRGFAWRGDEDKWVVDHHLNDRGNYVVAAAAYEVLLGRDIRLNGFKPDRVEEEDLVLLRQMVHEYLHDGERMPVCGNVPRPGSAVATD